MHIKKKKIQMKNTLPHLLNHENSIFDESN